MMDAGNELVGNANLPLFPHGGGMSFNRGGTDFATVGLESGIPKRVFQPDTGCGAPPGDTGKEMLMNEWWQGMVNMVMAEFSDLPDIIEFARVILRLAIAAALGGLLGWERERSGKAAGARTHMLVSTGAALLVLVPQQMDMSDADLSRVIQGIVTGVGFLGAGTILKGTSEQNVQGLTTAAGLWFTAAIGITAGLGREASAVLSTLLALIILHLVPRVWPRAGGS
jgi:putative Mg2+ transporter-C (MgtC) family protein